jgi:hypothetical protein
MISELAKSDLPSVQAVVNRFTNSVAGGDWFMMMGEYIEPTIIHPNLYNDLMSAIVLIAGKKVRPEIEGMNI